MNEGNKNSCFLVGLPQSGKSTFLAALWHVVETGEVEGSIKIESLPGDREYLNEIRQKWLNCEAFDRNKVGFFKPITLNYRNEASSTVSDFVIPDTSGELYSMQFEGRKLSEDYISTVKSANGVILFIDPDTLKKPILISDAIGILEGLNPGAQSGSQPEISGKDWKHSDAPTQVILIDLLQIISSYLERKIKLVIVISAWDLVTNSLDEALNKMKPTEWLQSELPLLYQFINSDNQWGDHIVFGISAQGSRYEGKNEKLQNFDNPSDRIIVQLEEQKSKDITMPLKWLINERV